jgi:Tol biopolymer transport system component
LASKYFTVTSSGGAVNVAGQCVAGGSQLQADCQVFNAATRERYLGKTYKADANDARGMAHRVADEILYAVTGNKGMASGKMGYSTSEVGDLVAERV